MASGEYSTYVTRRIGVGLRLGGGVMLTPLLMYRQAYDARSCCAASGRRITGGAAPLIHEQPHPLGFAWSHHRVLHQAVPLQRWAPISMSSYALGVDLGPHRRGVHEVHLLVAS